MKSINPVLTHSFQVLTLYTKMELLVSLLLQIKYQNIRLIVIEDVDPAFFDLNIPILGICYGLQELAWRLSPENVVAGTEVRIYLHACCSFVESTLTPSIRESTATQ